MATYEITTDKGKYEIDTEEPKKSDILKRTVGFLGKGAYEEIPFAKRLGETIDPFTTKGYETLGKPSNIPEQIAYTTGKTVPNILMASPLVKAAGVLPLIGRSAIASGAVGLGAYGGIKSGLQRGIQAVLPTAGEYAKQGAMYGLGGRLGATMLGGLGQIGERTGSALGSGVISAMQAQPDEKLGDFIFGTGLGALSPVPKYDIKSKIAPKLHFEEIGEKLGGISPETTKAITRDFGWDEVKRIGRLQQIDKDPITGAPQIKNAANLAKDYQNQGMIEARKQNGALYDKSLEAVKLKPEQISEVINGIKEQMNRIKDPSSPLHNIIDEQIASLMGLRKQGIQQVQGKFGVDELVNYLQRSGFENKTSLQTLHNLKQNMLENSGNFKKPFDRSNDEVVAGNIADYISNYIGDRSEGYRLATSEWSKMKKIEKEVYDFSSRDLSQDWNNMEPSLKNEYLNSLNKIDAYFQSKNLSQYQVKDMLRKYHAYQAWAGIKSGRLGPLRELLMMRMALGVGIGYTTGGKLGAILAPLAIYKYGRPKAYIPFLEKLKPGQKTGKVSPDTIHQGGAVAEALKTLLSG